MGKKYTVTQAILFLNEKFQGFAPQNEETLRRAIRSGRLKAELRRGKEGSLIEEDDLLSYGQNYALRLQVTAPDFIAAKVEERPVPETSLKCFVDVVKDAMEKKIIHTLEYKLRLIEARDRWAEKEGGLKEQMQKLQTELDQCQREMALFENEISGGEHRTEKAGNRTAEV